MKRERERERERENKKKRESDVTMLFVSLFFRKRFCVYSIKIFSFCFAMF